MDCRGFFLNNRRTVLLLGINAHKTLGKRKKRQVALALCRIFAMY